MSTFQPGAFRLYNHTQTMDNEYPFTIGWGGQEVGRVRMNRHPQKSEKWVATMSFEGVIVTAFRDLPETAFAACVKQLRDRIHTEL